MNHRRSLLVASLLAWLFYGNVSPPALATTASPSPDNFNEQFPRIHRRITPVQPLFNFIRRIKSGDANTLAGVYIAGVLSLPVIQQPAGDPAFVSSRGDTLTQFSMASDYGSTGILAHNTLSGSLFSELHPRQNVILVYGDGSIVEYVITAVKKYQALSPTSPFSDFMDLDHPGQIITSTELFETVYQSEQDRLVFQTCIAEGFEASWGRLFISAVPVSTTPLSPGSPFYIQ